MTSYLKAEWPLLILPGFSSVFSLSFDVVGLSFLLSSAQSAFLLGIAATRQASLVLMYRNFSFTFLGLVPWLHYSENVAIWRSFLTVALFIGGTMRLLNSGPRT